MSAIPTIEPSEIVAGDTIQWKKSLSSYPAGTWTLKYRLINSAGKFDITAVADGTDHLITITAAISATYTAGTYTWTAYVEKGTEQSLERYTIGTGTLIVKPNLAAQTTGYDNRSHAKKVLDAIEALLAGKATADVMSYTIGGRSISKMPPQELIKWRDIYKAEYLRELKAEKIKQGLDVTNNIYVRMP